MTVLTLSSRDGIFAKDGRGWYTSASGHAHGLQWPFPSTLLGALRTAWGRQQEAKLGRAFTQEEWEQAKQVTLAQTVVLRRSLAGAAAGMSARVWPVPLDTLFVPLDETAGKEAQLLRLDPLPPLLPTLGPNDDAAREALWTPRTEDQRKPDSRPNWWPEADFVDWLASNEDRSRDKVRWEGFRPPRRAQVHVGIDPESLAAKDGILFGYDVLETLDASDEQREWLIAGKVDGWGDAPGESTATLGGDRRAAVLERAEEALFAFPTGLADSFDRYKPSGLRLVVVTPMASGSGWLPQEFREARGKYVGRIGGVDAEVVLRAAFVGRPQHVSGWDMAARQPKDTTRLVPPGSVYHVGKADGAAFTSAEARNLWFAAIGMRTEEGFGRVVPGIWLPKEN